MNLNVRFTWCVLGFLVAAALPAASRPAGDEAEAELLKLEGEIAVAIVQSDVAFVQRVWGDDFFYTGVRGETKTKKEIVAELKASQLKFERMQFDDQRVRVYGETAVVTGRATTEGRGPQGEISGRFRYTRVYVKRNGQWQLVTFHGTPIAAADAKPQ
jgi:ketosteroid isomerase-like protein